MKNPSVHIGTLDTVSPEGLTQNVERFREVIARADGEIVLLNREVNGHSMMIAARMIANPGMADSPDADKYFYGWNKDEHAGIGSFTSALLVDIYAAQGDDVASVGHMDWWLQGDYANGGGNMHAARVSRTESEKLARERWGVDWDTIAFKLEPEYQGEGIGSLMIASSGVALAANGVTKFYTGALLDPAVAAYGRIGIDAENDFPRLRYEHGSKDWIYNRSLPIERISESPEVQSVIEHFVQ